jgi:hypothetical protein
MINKGRKNVIISSFMVLNVNIELFKDHVLNKKSYLHKRKNKFMSIFD